MVAERDAMAKVASPLVVQLYYSIQSQQHIFLVNFLLVFDMKGIRCVLVVWDGLCLLAQLFTK